MLNKPVVLLRRICAAHHVDKQLIEVWTVHPVERDLVQMRQPTRAEVEVAVGLEILVRQLPVELQLVLV